MDRSTSSLSDSLLGLVVDVFTHWKSDERLAM
jgi:hypothetical protein